MNSCFMSQIEPGYVYWVVVEYVLGYLHETINHELRHTIGKLMDTSMLINTESVVDRKSTSRRYCSLGSAMISWMSQKNKTIDLSTIEVEQIVASMANCEVVWLRKLFKELFEYMLGMIMIFCDI